MEVAPSGVYARSNHAQGDLLTRQHGWSGNRDVRIGQHKPLSYHWRRAFNKSPNNGNCACKKIVKRCRDRRVDSFHTEVRQDARKVEVPTARLQTRMMPTTVMVPEFKTVKVPVISYVTKHRVEYREKKTTRPPAVYRKSYTPIANMASSCNCYTPTCGCAGFGGCGCSFPSCACAPQSTELSENVHTTGVNRTYVRRVPVKIPYQEEVIKYVDQKIAV